MAGDAPAMSDRACANCFNPRPPISWRATWPDATLDLLCGGFNPRPPISWRATRRHMALPRRVGGFNPRPPISWRATTARPATMLGQVRFQSTPTNFMAGDTARPAARRWPRPFQSTPTNFMAGDMGVTRSQLPWLLTFQSTPTNFMAGDLYSNALRYLVACFNPRPPISWRATSTVPGGGILAGEFQSTPTNFMAGDWVETVGRSRGTSVSIHAHQFHGGRQHRASRQVGGVGGFNPRPPISWRATSLAVAHRRPARCFNPRPPISWRATGELAGGLVGHLVSIHAHQFHGGRRQDGARALDPGLFQSTPTNFMAGDALSTCADGTIWLFQSTPTNFMAGDAGLSMSPRTRIEFQSTPALLHKASVRALVD